jgi:outer membrane protein TolC
MTQQLKLFIKSIACLSLFISAASFGVDDDPFWREIWLAAKGHPEFSAFRASNDAASVNLAIEKARRYPVVSGVFSRMDGESSLANTPSAWQTGLQLKYSLFDNKRQSARDDIAESEGRFEQLTAAERLEEIMAELAFAYLDLWHAATALDRLTLAKHRVDDLLERMNGESVRAEFSPVERMPIEQYQLELRSLILDMRMLRDQATNQWALSGVEKPKQWQTLSDELPEQMEPASIRRLQEEVRIEAGRQSLAKREDGLNIDLNASHLVRQYDGTSQLSNHTIWSVSANMPLFDGGMQRTIIKRHRLRKITKENILRVALMKNESERATLRQWLENKNQLISNAQEHCSKLSKDQRRLNLLFKQNRTELADLFITNSSVDQCEMSLLSKQLERWHGMVRMATINGTLMAFIEGEF